MDSFPATTDGPNRITGGPVCLDIHAGITAGKPDSCCCCNPCLHATAPGFEMGCCKCFPAMICFTFTPNSYQSACCKSITLFALANFGGTANVGYSANFGGFTVSLGTERVNSYLDSGCQWRLHCSQLYDDALYPINHTIGDCFRPPPFSIVGVTTAGCTGTVTMSLYEPVKLPFHNAYPQDVIEKQIPYSPCKCNFAADHLCVGGTRHAGGPSENVMFRWNEINGDRWEYWPPGMTRGEANTAHLVETIYLRGDSYGNCYLELDFEQTGMDTNDWAEPPNSYDNNNPHNIRPGMIPIDSCVCGLVADSVTPSGNRSIRIHAGDCGRWKYLCGTCRCIPPTLCILGSTDDHGMFRGVATWDGSAWNYNDGYLTLRMTLVAGSTGECEMRVTSNYLLPFKDSLPIKCGNFLQSENSTAFAAGNPTKHAFIWASGSACGCGSTPRCGPCVSRCGGPPETLHLTVVEGVRDLPGLPYFDAFECTYGVTLEFWDRSGLTPQCGYIGESYYICQGVTYRVVAYMNSPGWLMTVQKYSTTTGLLVNTQVFPYDLSSPTYCDPYEFRAEHNPSGEGAYYKFSVLE